MTCVPKYLLAYIFIIISSVFFAHSQGNSHLRDAEKEDSSRVDFLLESASKKTSVNSKEAMLQLKEAEALANKLLYKKGKALCYLQMAKIYHSWHAYDQAHKYASEGSAIAHSLNVEEYKKPFFLLLSEIEYDKNNTTPDSTLREEVRDMVAAIKYKYYLKDSLDKTEEKAVLLQKNIKSQEDELIIFRLQWFLWGLAFSVLLIIMAFGMVWFNMRKAKLENKQLLTEQKLKRSQMNPHFIFNSIQNVRSLIHGNKDEAAVDYLNKFSKLTRQVLESSNENYMSLTDEVNMLQNYLSIQQLLYGNTFGFSIHVANDIDTDSYFLPPMLAQPFVENAIKHGLAGKRQGGLVSVKFFIHNKKLYFEVSDNGAGFSASKQTENHKSMAISITKERLSHYTKKINFYFEAVDIKNANDEVVGAKVLFEIPYIYEK